MGKTFYFIVEARCCFCAEEYRNFSLKSHDEKAKFLRWTATTINTRIFDEEQHATYCYRELKKNLFDYVEYDRKIIIGALHKVISSAVFLEKGSSDDWSKRTLLDHQLSNPISSIEWEFLYNE